MAKNQPSDDDTAVEDMGPKNGSNRANKIGPRKREARRQPESDCDGIFYGPQRRCAREPPAGKVRQPHDKPPEINMDWLENTIQI